MANINRKLAEELGVREQQVEATVALLDGGATVPFVARYRKEITGALDDAQLRALEERLNYLRELEERRIAILNSVREQGKLDAALEAAILAADSKVRLEDIYLPFKPKRRTKAEIAKEAGLEPLADLLLAQPEDDPQAVAVSFIGGVGAIDLAKRMRDGVARFGPGANILIRIRAKLTGSDIAVQDYLRCMPISRIGTPDDVGAIVGFLLSDAAGWITGQVIGVDGGHTIRRGPELVEVFRQYMSSDK